MKKRRKKPYFEFNEETKERMSKIIQNALAPVVTITIKVDFRTKPEGIEFSASQALPGAVVQKVLLNCVGQLVDMQMQAEARAANMTPGQREALDVPDLPPAPKTN